MAQKTHEKEFEKLVGKYLMDSIKGEWKNIDHKINDSLTLKQIRNFPVVQGITNEYLMGILISNLNGLSIGNISVYLTETISILDTELANFKRNLPDIKTLDKSIKKKSYHDSFIGCQIHCPLCGRKCDGNYQQQNHLHNCNTGHQFKVFGGSKYENNEPSFESCNSMNDQDDVIYENNTIKWSEFRKNNPKWDYASDPIERFNIIDKNKKIWNLIGQKVCDHYSSLGNKIIYKEYSEIKNSQSLGFI